MSTTTKTVSQKDYLKKYLGKTKKKKKVKSDKINKKNLKLIDDNIDTYQSFEGETLIESGEDAPVVVAIIDERPAQIRLLEHYKNSNRWKPVSNADTKDNESPEIRLINDADSNKNDNYLSKVDSKSGNEYVKSDTKHRSKVDSKSEDEYVKSDTKHRSKVDSKSGDEYVKSDTKHRSKVDSKSGDEYVKSDTKHRSKVDSKSGDEYVKSDTKHRSKVDSKSEDEYVKSDTKHRSKVDSKSGNKYVKSDTKHRSKVDSNSGDEYVKSDTKHRSKVDSKSEDEYVKSDTKHRSKVDSNSGDEYVKSDTKQHSKTNKYKRKHRSKSTSNAKAVLMMTDETLGKNAGTIYRDKKTGKKRDFEAEKLKKIEKRRREDEKKEQYYQWGKGLKQIEDEKTKLKDDLHEMSKPLARYADDDDLDKMLGNQDREGDPLLEYVQNKRMKKEAKEGKITKPKYKGSYAPNRFDIPPSHKWDGVDRSNGFEQKWFEKQSSKKAL